MEDACAAERRYNDLPHHAKEDALKALKATTIAMFTALALVAVSAGLVAQQTGFKRTVLQQRSSRCPDTRP